MQMEAWSLMVSRTHSLDVFSDGVILPSVSVPVSDIWRVKEDQFTTYQLDTEETDENGVRLNAPCPAVFRTGTLDDPKSFQRTVFGKEYQFMAADLLALRKYGVTYGFLAGDARNHIRTAFNGLYPKGRAFNNGAGVDDCNNYITGEINRGEDPRIDPLICAGDTVRVLETRTNSRGIVMGLLQSFRSPAVASLNDVRVLRATIINERGELRNFPQLDGIQVPYPYISSQDVWYPLDDLEKVT